MGGIWLDILRVRATGNSVVSSWRKLIDNVPLDGLEITGRAVVHERVSSKYERMVIDIGYRSPRRSTDMGEQDFGFRIGTYRQEVAVIPWRLNSLVESWT